MMLLAFPRVPILQLIGYLLITVPKLERALF